MKRVFLTFADSRLRRSLERLRSEANALGAFDEIYVLNEVHLDPNFRKRYGEKLQSCVRGYGYWCWKPQVIGQVLSQLEDGDLLLYVDAGCHLNAHGIKRLDEYFRIAEKSENGLLAFQTVPPVFPLQHDGRPLPDLTEKLWTKSDVFEYFGVRNNPDVTDTQQFGSGIIFFRKCKKSESLVRDWINAVDYSFSMLDDSPSLLENAIGFIEHRHDQSLFSILCKINQVDRLSSYEYWYPKKNSMKPDWDALKMMPIHAKRLRDYGAVKNLQKFLENKIHGLSKRFSAYSALAKNKL